MLDLLVEWEDRKAAGNPATPEELCRDYPDRLEDLRRHVEQLAALDPVLALTRPETAEWPAIPGFELLGEINQGGMGVVYRARDQLLDWVVAVKVPFGAGRSFSRKRFEREAQTLAKLRHPGIVPVHAAGLVDGTPYFVMQYIGGGILAERIDEIAGDPIRIATLMTQVALAVDHAHAAGIVHRDLKPSNILLDEVGRPFVSDFGVAALLAGEPLTTSSDDTPDDRHPVQTRLTRTGAAVGTPAYSAPEQYDPARFGSVGPATDVWALGVILYELLMCRRPFLGTAWEELREQVCSGVVPPVPGVGRRLQRVINRCLATDPAGRFRTASELADALVAAEPRPRWWVAGVLIAALTIVGGYAFYSRPEPTVQVWPNVPAVRESQDRLSRGKVIELVGHGKHPTVFDWVTGPGSGRVISQPNEDFRIVSLSPVGCLIELLPALPPGRYRVDAELFHETGNGMSWVGLYAGASHCEIRRGRQHFLLTARYSDRGLTAEENPNGHTVISNRRTHLIAQYLGDSDTDLMAGSVVPAPHPNNRLVPAPPVGWRAISLTIGRNSVAAAQADTGVGVMSLGEAEQTFTAAQRKYPDLPDAGWSVRPLGGIGLYVFNGSLAVRLFRVTPLS